MVRVTCELLRMPSFIINFVTSVGVLLCVKTRRETEKEMEG